MNVSLLHATHLKQDRYPQYEKTARHSINSDFELVFYVQRKRNRDEN